VRLTVAVVLVALGLGVSPAGAVAATQDGEFVLGSGNGIATTVLVGPQTGGLTVSVTFGQALADFQGRVARASARAIDFGVIELALTAPPCPGKAPSFTRDQFPQPLDADSRDGASNAGKSEQENGTEPGSPLFATVGRKFVQALPVPESRSLTTTAGFGVEGVIEVGTGVAEVVSRVVDDGAREVYGSVDVASVELLDGAIRMGGLHWQAIHRTGKDPESTGSFSIASLTINGTPVPVPGGGTEAAQALAAVNAVLLGTGLSIVAPEFSNLGGAAHITPLTVQLVDSPLGRAVVAPAVTAGQPVREAFFDAYYDQFECGGTLGEVQYVGSVGRGAVLPSDIALSALTGTGGFVLELGGVRTLTEGETFDNPFDVGGGSGLGQALDVSAGVGGSVDVLGSDFTAADSFTGATDAAVPVPDARVETDGNASLAGLDRALPGKKGGAALTIGLIGLVIVACVAVADYLHMQRGHRVIPEIE
jgi:hypothetical protein